MGLNGLEFESPVIRIMDIEKVLTVLSRCDEVVFMLFLIYGINKWLKDTDITGLASLADDLDATPELEQFMREYIKAE